MKLKQMLEVFALLLIVALSSAIRGETQGGGRAKEDRSVPASVRQLILEQILNDRPTLLECFEEEGQARKEEYLANISVDAIDLNGDHQPELFVEPSGGCDCGVRNCYLWVYRQTSAGFKLILDSDGLGLGPERTQTNGYLDISIEAQGTAFTRFRSLYKFDGHQYREHRTDFINMETGEVKPASRRVQFPRGGTSTIVSGKVSPGFGDTYLVGARAGQRMVVRLTRSGKSITFLVLSPGAKQTLVDRVKTWTGVLPESGNYRVLVDGDETGETYKMMIAVQ